MPVYQPNGARGKQYSRGRNEKTGYPLDSFYSVPKKGTFFGKWGNPNIRLRNRKYLPPYKILYITRNPSLSGRFHDAQRNLSLEIVVLVAKIA